MKSALSPALIVCLVVSGVPLAAQSPLLRTITREADRVAAEQATQSRVPPPALGSGGRPVELRWNELAPLIHRKSVALILTSGITVRGEAMVVRDDALVLDVAGSSNSTAYPKGNSTIPRASVAMIRLERMRGSWGRNLGTTIGLLSGLMIGGYVTAQVADSAGTGIPVFLALASGMTVAGYYSGKGLDRKVTLIRIVP